MLHSPPSPTKKRPLAAVPATPFVVGEVKDHRPRLRSIRLKALAEFAPLLAGTATSSAFVLAVALFPRTKASHLTLWLLMVVLASALMVRHLVRCSVDYTRRDPSAATLVRAGLFVGLVAAIWVAMPAAAFASQSDAVRMVVIGALCAMMCGSLSIAAAPIAATLWAGILAAGLGIALHGNGHDTSLPLTGLVLAQFGFLIAVIRRTATLLARRTEREVRDQFEADATAELMREYEERGTSCLWQTDAGHILTYATPGITTLLGRPSKRLIGSSLPSVVGGNGVLGSALLARAPFSGIEVEIATSETRRAITFAGTPIIDSRGVFLGFRGNCSDVTETRSSERRLRQLVSLDLLTELPNRMRMRELLGEALLAARASGRPCGLLLLDLDGFKPVNDTFGHPKGDLLLKTVAERLVAEVGRHGIVGRLGGDEFAVVLHDAQNRRFVTDLAELLIRRVSEPYSLDGVSVRIGVSVGGAFGPLDGDTVEDLVKKADMALYEAKDAGRGTYRPFHDMMQTEADNRLKLEHELREALARGQFRLAYQPLIDSRSHQVSGFEALVRWQHPERGFVPPIEFVPLAEETGLIHELGEWVIETAIRDCARWPSSISVAVNISPIQLLSPRLPALISDALARSRLPANRLELEVTESVFLRDTNGSLDVLRRLRALGIRIALDDFGTGYSSLGYLNRTIFNKLKIDGSFVRGAAARPETISIIQAIVTLANSFQMTITAEGVETQDDYRRMTDLGCHQMQGFLFGRPVPFDRATELVGTHWNDARLLTRI